MKRNKPAVRRRRPTKTFHVESLESRELLAVIGSFQNGIWNIDANGNNVLDDPGEGDVQARFGDRRDVPITGDWTGSGADQIGTYRAGLWRLDSNHDLRWDGVRGGDTEIRFGKAGDAPVVGDWDGDGIDQIGTFAAGLWRLDMNQDGRWDGPAGGDVQFTFGSVGDDPVVGDWNGDGIDDIGTYQTLGQRWRLDSNSDHSWNSGIDEEFRFSKGSPIIADWSASGSDSAGQFLKGFWSIDVNVNNRLDKNSGEGNIWQFGIRRALPVIFDTFSNGDLDNRPPVLAPIGNKLTVEATLLQFAAIATDPDLPANTLTFSLGTDAPAGASIDSDTGVFTWIPTAAQGPASYTVTVRVTDSGLPALSDSETITISVTEPSADNRVPTLDSIGNQTIDELVQLRFTATASDPDGDDLSFALDAGAPTGATIHTTSGVFTWTPSESQGPGTYTATVRVTDSGQPGLSDSESITITVRDVNSPPVLSSIGNKSVTAGSTLQFTARASDADIPANTLRFSLDPNAPAGASIDPITGAFAWSTSADAEGTYSVTVRVTDNGSPALSNTETFQITAAPLGATIRTHHDNIPNFAYNPTIVSASSGPWSDPGTWSLGRLPNADDVVVISPATVVTLDTTSAIAITVGIQQGGELSFRTDVDTRLAVGTLLVMEGGLLQVGSEASPISSAVKAEILIRDIAIDTTNDGVGVYDPEQYGTGIIGLGTVHLLGSPVNDGFVRLAVEPRLGDTTLTLEEPVTGWRAGDRLILPDTRQLDWNERGNYAGPYVPQWEELTLTAESSGGTVLTLASPLQFDHRGARDGDGVLRYLPHVGNLTRNVTVRSENPLGTRGHTFFTHIADVDVRYVTFKDLGRTKWDPALDNTTFDANGNVTHIGTNQIARYPIHAHHLIGPDPGSSPANGHQFTLVGNAVDGGSDAHKFRWGITIHESHYGLIRQNVVYNYGGCGVCTEDGSESFNVIEKNFVVRVWGNGDRLGGGRDGVGFWFRGPNNIVRDNVAASIVPTGYNYGFNVFAYNLGPVRVPLFAGADTSMEGQYRLVDMNATPLLEFARNETYGATTSGLALWWLGRHDSSPIGDAGMVKDFRVWNVFTYGYYGYDTNHLTMDGFTALGDPNRGELGIWFGDYWQSGVRITGANIQGFAVGIITPYAADGATIIENSYLRNKVNIQVSAAWSSGSASRHPPKSAVIRNVRFAAPAGQPLRSIFMSYAPTGSAAGSNLIQKDEVFVYDYNGVAGDNFQVYYKEQHPDFVVPETGSNDNLTNPLVGAPRGDIGLTNVQLVAKYPDGATIEGQFYQTVAIAGAIAPCTDDTTRPEIYGFVFPT